MLVQRKEFFEMGQILNNLRSRRKYSNNDADQKYEEIGLRWSKAYIFLIIVALINFTIKPILAGRRILPSVGYSPCDIQHSLTCYLVNYIAQCSAGTYVAFTVIALDLIFCSLLFYGYFEIEYVKNSLLNLKIDRKHSDEDPKVLKQIAFIVEHHDQTLRLV